VEEKEFSLVWHYRKAKPYYAQKHLVILKRLLTPIAKANNLSVQQGSMILEVRPQNIHKGAAAAKQLNEHTEFILAIGDDPTDEDMFASMPARAYTIKVGRGRTAARYRAKNVNEVLEFLKKLR